LIEPPGARRRRGCRITATIGAIALESLLRLVKRIRSSVGALSDLALDVAEERLCRGIQQIGGGIADG
jgi:hypothetical protein